jgi:hypothetical protein
LAPKICDMNPHSFFCILGCPPSQNQMTQTKFGAACRSEINTFYRVHLSQPFLEILIFLGIVYISDLNVFRRVRSRVNHITDSPHVDHFVTTYSVQITVSISGNRT